MARIVLVGHCGADGRMLRSAIRSSIPTVEVVQADDQATLDAEFARATLLLVNRVLEGDYAHAAGIDLIREVAALDVSPKPATMLVSNFEDAQHEAEAAGARPGFGKRDLNTPKMSDRLKDAISSITAT